MLAALEGRPVDRIPIAPYFWGAEYVWKIMDRPIWEVLHGEGDITTQVLEALDDRHGLDWVIPLHWSSQQLRGKTFVREDRAHAYFTEDATGEEYVFHKEGHWLAPISFLDREPEESKPALDPPTTKALKRTNGSSAFTPTSSWKSRRM